MFLMFLPIASPIASDRPWVIKSSSLQCENSNLAPKCALLRSYQKVYVISRSISLIFGISLSSTPGTSLGCKIFPWYFLHFPGIAVLPPPPKKKRKRTGQAQCAHPPMNNGCTWRPHARKASSRRAIWGSRARAEWRAKRTHTWPGQIDSLRCGTDCRPIRPPMPCWQWPVQAKRLSRLVPEGWPDSTEEACWLKGRGPSSLTRPNRGQPASTA